MAAEAIVYPEGDHAVTSCTVFTFDNPVHGDRVSRPFRNEDRGVAVSAIEPHGMREMGEDGIGDPEAPPDR